MQGDPNPTRVFSAGFATGKTVTFLPDSLFAETNVITMRYFLTVHGIVQGVGFRALVKGVAIENKICGYVRNMPDGSVTVLAIGNNENLDSFVRGIDVDTNWGPKVFEIELLRDGDENFLLITEEYSEFKIIKE